MTSIRFLNGLDTIGGNIAELTQGDSRLIFDFGVAADLSGETVASAIDAGKLPALPELFADRADGFLHEAILISHLHIDHMGALQYLRKNIPIYMSPDSLRLYQTLIAEHDEPPVANLHALPPETLLQIGAFTVEGFLSDHDEPGAMALAIDDGDHLYVHSGDVRLNGPHRARVEHWAQTLRARRVKMLLLEGTTFSFDSQTPVEDAANPAPTYTEASLQPAFGQLLDEAPQLVVLNPYNRNWERLAAFQQTAHAHGRQVAWTKLSAAILENVAGVTPDRVASAALAAQPERYVLENDFEHLSDLADLPVSVYVHSNGVPLGDYDPHFAQLLAFLAAHQIPIEYLSATGHATKADLRQLCQWVAPAIVVPWHSFKPEAEAEDLDQQTKAAVLLPEKGLYYTVDAEDED